MYSSIWISVVIALWNFKSSSPFFFLHKIFAVVMCLKERKIKAKLSWFSGLIRKFTNVRRSLQVSKSCRKVSLSPLFFYLLSTEMHWPHCEKKKETEDEILIYKYNWSQIIEILQQRQLSLIARSKGKKICILAFESAWLMSFEVQTDLFSLFSVTYFMKSTLLPKSKPLCSLTCGDWHFLVALWEVECPGLVYSTINFLSDISKSNNEKPKKEELWGKKRENHSSHNSGSTRLGYQGYYSLMQHC